jgi:methyl-accepting chemotaxis protein
MASLIEFAVFTLIPIGVMVLSILYTSIKVYKINDLRPVLLIALLTMMTLHQLTEIGPFISGSYYRTTSPTAEAFESGANVLASIASFSVLQQVAELHTTRDELEATNMALTERSSMVSVLNRILRHNVRNETNIITGLATDIREEITDDSLQRDLKTIENRASRLVTISDRTRHVKRLLTEDSSETSKLQLPDDLKSHLDRLREAYPGATISLEATCESDVVVRGPSSFPRSLADVIERIVVANNESVHIGVTVSREQSQIQEGSGTVNIEIDDDGTGLPELDVDAIESETETPLQHAEGLCLWCLKWAVVRADGELNVDSPAATVEIQLPLSDFS